MQASLAYKLIAQSCQQWLAISDTDMENYRELLHYNSLYWWTGNFACQKLSPLKQVCTTTHNGLLCVIITNERAATAHDRRLQTCIDLTATALTTNPIPCT